jgi:hypothetical protein
MGDSLSGFRAHRYVGAQDVALVPGDPEARFRRVSAYCTVPGLTLISPEEVNFLTFSLAQLLNCPLRADSRGG